MWYWLAMIIRGSSQAVNVRRGVVSGSEDKWIEWLRRLLSVWLKNSRGIRLMVRLCVVKLIQIVLSLESHVVGSSIVVGITIFNIGAGSGC